MVEVFHKTIEYNKDQKSYEQRKAISQWPNTYNRSFESTKEGVIKVHQDINSVALKTSNLIIFHPGTDAVESTSMFNITRGQKSFEIFRFIQKGEAIEVHLMYDYFTIGEPKRDSYKLCNLKEKQVVEIKINGKLDHTLSRGSARLYKERHYVFKSLGAFHSVELCSKIKGFEKQKFPKIDKVVDLMKVLY